MAEPYTVVPGAYVGGLRYVDILGESARGRVFLHGAHVTSWVPDGAAESVIWLSERAQFAEGVAIRGGVPICFPWFGPDVPPAGGPAHGLARLVDWHFDGVDAAADGAVTARFSVDSSSDAPDPGWHEAFRVRPEELGEVRFRAVYSVTFGDTLTTSLRVTNTGDRALGFEAAIHSYYAVSDITQVAVSGLEGISYEERAAGAAQEERRDVAEVRFAGEVDRLYAQAPSRVTLTDAGLGRTIRLDSSGAAGWVVWNPHVAKAERMADFGDDEWRGMVCLEPVCLGENTVWLQPGESHTISVTTTLIR